MVLTLTSAGLSILLVQATKPADATIAATVMMVVLNVVGFDTSVIYQYLVNYTFNRLKINELH